MCKFFNTFARVIILFHVIEAHMGLPKIQNGSSTCLQFRVCETNTCKELAKYMLRRIDPSTDPCTDFYQFTCGKYLRGTEETLPNLYKTVARQAEDEVTNILNEQEAPNDSDLLKVLKNAHQKCINGGKNIQDYRSMLQEFGGLPMLLSNWTEDHFSWTNMFKVARKYGHEANDIFSITVGQDPKNYTRKLIYVDLPKKYNRPVHSFGFEHLSAISLVMLFGKNFIYEITQAFGVDENAPKIEVDEILKFTNEVNEVFENKSIDYNIRTISELNSLCPSVPWLDIINILIDPIIYNNSDEIVVKCPECMRNLHQLLERTPKRMIANHLLFNFITENLYLLNDPLRVKLLGHFNGATAKIVCRELTIKYFYMILDHVYIDRFYNLENTRTARFIFNNIVAELKHILNRTNLFESEQQKEVLIEKLEAMRSKIGVNEERILNYDRLEEYYKKINLTVPGHYLWEMRSYLFAKTYNSLQKIEKPSKFMRASSIKASYSYVENHMYMSAAILQTINVMNVPQYINYGRIGFPFAHEITHGYGPIGIHYDMNGVKNNRTDDSTIGNLEKSRQCIAYQFGKYKIPGTSILVLGDKVANEAISDNGGYYVSYHAYSNSEVLGTEKALPGFENYTAKQMFWITYATSWCEKFDPKQVQDLITDPHPVAVLRVNVGLQNSKEFAQDFQCAQNSPMNPEDKCPFWDF